MQWRYLVLVQVWQDGGTLKKGRWVWVDDEKLEKSPIERLNEFGVDKWELVSVIESDRVTKYYLKQGI